jgi:hypothetical protein
MYKNGIFKNACPTGRKSALKFCKIMKISILTYMKYYDIVKTHFENQPS